MSAIIPQVFTSPLLNSGAPDQPTDPYARIRPHVEAAARIVGESRFKRRQLSHKRVETLYRVLSQALREMRRLERAQRLTEEAEGLWRRLAAVLNACTDTAPSRDYWRLDDLTAKAMARYERRREAEARLRGGDGR